MHSKAKLGVAVMVCVAAMSGPAVVASAATPPEGKQAAWGFIRNLQTNRCLEERPGGGVYTGDVPCRGDNDQTWQWVYLGDNASKLVNKSTRHCLGTSNGEVRDLSCGGGASQAWYRDPNGKIRQVSSNGFLSSDWAGEVFLSDGGTASSRWY